MERRWSRWKVWLIFLLVVMGTALVVIPRAEGAGTDMFSSSDYAGALAAFEKELSEMTGSGSNTYGTPEPVGWCQKIDYNRSMR